MVPRVGAFAIGFGIACLGGAVLADPKLVGIGVMPYYQVLAKENGFDNTYTENTFGKKYGRYLAASYWYRSYYWWHWAFQRWDKSKPDTGKFSKDAITMPYSYYGNGENAKALNQVCKAAYGTAENEVTEDSSNDKFKKSEIWKYCSPVGQEPTTVKNYDRKDGLDKKRYEAKTTEDGKTTELIGKHIESELVSVFDPHNAIFWDIRNQEFYGKGLFPRREGLAKNEQANTFFWKGKKDNKHIKNLCEEAYKQSKDNTKKSPTQATREETLSYCSFIIPPNPSSR